MIRSGIPTFILLLIFFIPSHLKAFGPGLFGIFLGQDFQTVHAQLEQMFPKSAEIKILQFASFIEITDLNDMDRNARLSLYFTKNGILRQIIYSAILVPVPTGMFDRIVQSFGEPSAPPGQWELTSALHRATKEDTVRYIFKMDCAGWTPNSHCNIKITDLSPELFDKEDSED